MQAITTKYLCATNFKGSRIKASCARGSITISYPDEAQNTEAAHVLGRKALIAKFIKEDAKRYGTNRNPWSGPWICGDLSNSGQMAHVSPGINSSAVIIECGSIEDCYNLTKYLRETQKHGGQLSALHGGLVGSILKRSTLI